MHLYDESTASTFPTKADCQTWIRDRVVRFKLTVETVELPDGEPVLAHRKTNGRILNITAEGYEPNTMDEPLKRYARPVRKGDKWMAAMLLDR